MSLSNIKENFRHQQILWAITGAVCVALGSFLWMRSRIREKEIKKLSIIDVIGNTPLVFLPRLSRAVGCNIYVKLQYLNPFGSSKDRAVKQFLTSPTSSIGQEVVQASSGSTAISLVQLGHILKRKVTLFLPNDLAQDKYTLLQILKANIVKVPPVSIVDENHFFNLALRYSNKRGAYFTNQFQNLQNAKAHYQSTGPQIYKQTEGLIDCFICSAGTGGTLAGVSQYLKEKRKDIKVVLADPQGSGLFNKIKYDVLFTRQEKEGHRLRNPFDTVVEGIGLNRPTANFEAALIDDAYKVSDQQALHMGHYLVQNQGLLVGGSSAVNLVAAVKEGRSKKGCNIVTIVHDSGNRYIKKFYNEQYLKDKKIAFNSKIEYDPQDLSFVK